MPGKRLTPFGRTKAIESQLDEFMDIVSEAGMVFERFVTTYLEEGVTPASQEKIEQIQALETRGDAFRRAIETALYTQMLIPEFRGDVLSLLDDLDDLTDLYESNLLGIVVEHPEIPEELKADIRTLTSTAVQAVESIVLASRALFRDTSSVRDHVHKTGFLEHEADKIALRLHKYIFDSPLDLAQKMHLRGCVYRIARLSDQAENVGDRLTIYAIKRTL